MDFPIVFDTKSAEPLFVQLSKALKQRIIEGGLQAGAALPPSRELAESLGVSRGTVVKAYDDLIAQGYLESRTGSSTFVSKRAYVEREAQREMERTRNASQPSASKHLSADGRKLMEMSLSEGVAGHQPDLNYGAPPADMLPLAQWKDILATQCRRTQPHHFDTTPETLGHYRLRVEIASYLARAKGLNCEPEQVIVFPGSQQAHTYLAKLLLDPGDKVIVENPGYGGARDIFSDRGAKVVPISIDADGIVVNDIEALTEPARLVYITPSYHDPTGVVMSLDRRKQLLQWASNKDVLLVEDAWDSDYVYVHPPQPSLQGLDKDNRVIFLYSFWKVLYPLTTVGCAVVPPSLVPVFDRLKFLSERQFPILEHFALAEFLKTGGLSRHIKKTKVQYEKRRKELIGSLFGLFKTDIEIVRQSAGLHLCVRVKPHLLRRGLVEAAREAGLPMVSTEAYYVGTPRDDEFLLPFAGISDDDIQQRIATLAKL